MRYNVRDVTVVTYYVLLITLPLADLCSISLQYSHIFCPQRSIPLTHPNTSSSSNIKTFMFYHSNFLWHLLGWQVYDTKADTHICNDVI